MFGPQVTCLVCGTDYSEKKTECPFCYAMQGKTEVASNYQTHVFRRTFGNKLEEVKKFRREVERLAQAGWEVHVIHTSTYTIEVEFGPTSIAKQ